MGDKKKAKELLIELLEKPFPNEDRQADIIALLKTIIPDPMFTDYIYYSEDFVNKDGSFNCDELIKKCFDDYEPNVIAL